MSFFSNGRPPIPGEQSLWNLTAEDVRTAFREHEEELAWLAIFLTANAKLAQVCVVDACARAATQSDVLVECVEGWTRCCTIRSAIEMQQSRISLLASIYERTPCRHRNHVSLAPGVLDLLYDYPEEPGLRLDVLCRAALVLRGSERYSSTESALMLGVSRTAVEAAYCTALGFLEVLSCEMLTNMERGTQPCC